MGAGAQIAFMIDLVFFQWYINISKLAIKLSLFFNSPNLVLDLLIISECTPTDIDSMIKVTMG